MLALTGQNQAFPEGIRLVSGAKDMHLDLRDAIPFGVDGANPLDAGP
jgi:hypothetical protein